MILIHDVNFDTKYDQILHIYCQEPSTSSKYDCVHHAFIVILTSWKFEYNSGVTNYVDSWCQIWYQR